MKNYKFMIKMPPKHIIALDTLRDKIVQTVESISDAKYGNTSTKLSIKFRTPTRDNASKELTLAIFMSGKINILGGLDVERAGQVCEFVNAICARWHHRVIVPCGGTQIIEPNIEQDDDLIAMVRACVDPMRVIMDFTEEEVEELRRIIP